MRKFSQIFLLFLVLALFMFAGTACKKRTYAADGVFTAFETKTTKSGGPELVVVEVTIENDKITKFNIDTVQSYRTTGRGGSKAWAFNTESKKEKGYKYGMHNNNPDAGFDLDTQEGINAYKKYLKDNNLLEWFEQAELVEKFWLEKGVDAVKVDDEGYFDNIANVTIVDNYTKVAKKAIENAKKGLAIALAINGSDVVWAEAKVDKNGKFTSLKLDTLQGDTDQETGKFTWHAKTKQQKQYEYGMHNNLEGAGFDLKTTEGINNYKKFLKDNNLLEWFEQANIISDFVLKNGVNKLEPFINNNGKIEANEGDAVAAVTITVSHYFKALTKLYDNFSK